MKSSIFFIMISFSSAGPPFPIFTDSTLANLAGGSLFSTVVDILSGISDEIKDVLKKSWLLELIDVS